MNKYEEYFMEVVRRGSLVRAAQGLFLSQPSLTKHIQRLEKQLGTALFDRSVSPMRLSDAGQIYYAYLLEQSQREQELMERLGQAAGGFRGKLRLGMPSFFAQCYLSQALERFRREYPLVEVELVEASGEVLEQAVISRRVDLAVLHLPLTHWELESRPLFMERILLAVPGGGGVREGLPENLAELEFILPQNEQKLGRFAADFFAKRGIRPRIRMRTQNVHTMLSLAARGMGAGFLPEGGLPGVPSQILEQLSFYHSPEMEMQVAAVSLHSLPEYTLAFIRCLERK